MPERIWIWWQYGRDNLPVHKWDDVAPVDDDDALDLTECCRADLLAEAQEEIARLKENLKYARNGWNLALDECVSLGKRLSDMTAERDEAVAARDHDAKSDGPDIAAIEASGKRWHGEDHRVIAVRWEPYKPDGQRQRGTKGRWQEQVGSGDYWRWQNCDRPAALRATAVSSNLEAKA